MNIARKLCATALLAFAAPASAQDAPTVDPIALGELDGFLTGVTLGDRFSGVVLVAQGGRVVFEKAYGKRDERSPARAPDLLTTDTRFNLGSAGRMFTAVAVLQQVAAGKLKLDTKVGQVLKDYPNRKFRNVTVRQLLADRAGAGDIALFGVENAVNRGRYRTAAEMVAAFGARGPAFKPGSQQQPSDFGYVVLGRMVEVLSGEQFEAYLARNVFAAAGMTRTDHTPCGTGATDLAVGYVTLAGQRQRNCVAQPLAGFAAGWQVGTARDLLRFATALDEGKLIPKPLLAQAVAAAPAGGLGLGTGEYWGQAGGGAGTCAELRRYPRAGETIVVLANRDPAICSTVAGYLPKQRERR
ncbi:serine hydrolase domain-containing protein [Sphingomonas sp.]|uniref:serine hydrolase domain-containing protein n=1 Tax=Sphingomonas sp. TaxID=28214 RepID=UPI002D7FF72A|nr:serine hydrolase domain-containing protein [Sphingomonas sp.]HEU0045928.1 serine hydrolase domain-containing protein [Sphingomonas sp.]